MQGELNGSYRSGNFETEVIMFLGYLMLGHCLSNFLYQLIDISIVQLHLLSLKFIVSLTLQMGSVVLLFPLINLDIPEYILSLLFFKSLYNGVSTHLHCLCVF